MMHFALTSHSKIVVYSVHVTRNITLFPRTVWIDKQFELTAKTDTRHQPVNYYHVYCDVVRLAWALFVTQASLTDWLDFNEKTSEE